MKKLLALLMLLLATPVAAQSPGSNAGGVYPYGYYTTYSASATDIVTAAAATDVACIIGSDTRTVIVKKITLAGSTGNVITVSSHINIIKRSTANSGGTSSVISNVPHDSQAPAGTAVVRAYTANPTVGTAVGTVIGTQLIFAVVADWPAPFTPTFGDDGTQGIILRGASQSLCVNLNGATITTSGALDASFVWIEQ